MVESYAEILNRITNHQKLDLAACSQQELFAFLDKAQDRHSPTYYRLNIILLKKALRLLKRKELAELLSELGLGRGELANLSIGDI